MKKIQPLGKNILVKLVEAEKVTESGIIIPGQEEAKNQGIVEALGDSKEINSKIKVGSKVLFDSYEGVKVDLGKDKMVIIESKKILAIVE